LEQQAFKKRVLRVILEESVRYKSTFVDYEYLVISKHFKKRKYYIIDASKDNYLHLTGVKTTLSPRCFFDKCLNRTLEESEFAFGSIGQDEKAAKGSVRRKIKVLPLMMSLFDSIPLVQEGFSKNKVSCSFATSDGKFTLGFSDSIKVKPKTLMAGNMLKNPQSIDLILRKHRCDKHFTEIMYGNVQEYLDEST